MTKNNYHSYLNELYRVMHNHCDHLCTENDEGYKSFNLYKLDHYLIVNCLKDEEKEIYYGKISSRGIYSHTMDYPALGEVTMSVNRIENMVDYLFCSKNSIEYKSFDGCMKIKKGIYEIDERIFIKKGLKLNTIKNEYDEELCSYGLFGDKTYEKHKRTEYTFIIKDMSEY